MVRIAAFCSAWGYGCDPSCVCGVCGVGVAIVIFADPVTAATAVSYRRRRRLGHVVGCGCGGCVGDRGRGLRCGRAGGRCCCRSGRLESNAALLELCSRATVRAAHFDRQIRCIAVFTLISRPARVLGERGLRRFALTDSRVVKVKVHHKTWGPVWKRQIDVFHNVVRTSRNVPHTHAVDGANKGNVDSVAVHQRFANLDYTVNTRHA